MEKEKISISELDITLIINFFKKLNRQGPGGEEQTLKALSFISNLPANPRIADVGCGTGFQTSVLASHLDSCTITAVDLFPGMIGELNERIQRENLGDKVTGMLASMDHLPFEANEFDLFWAEGSIYNIGFEKGLVEWRKYIKPHGFIAVTECSWLSNLRPKNSSYLTENFIEIDSISNKLKIMTDAGYLPVAHFVLPEHCWIENYYVPMRQRMQPFLKENNNSVAAKMIVETLNTEIPYYYENKAYYGYVFYIGQKVD
jgi:ubiquinone/menaquinone biosynthesis C-methylase UbiE